MYATPQDVRTALSLLSPADYLRLRSVARTRTGAAAHDLVADAISTAFIAACGHGGRRWRRDVPLMAYLMMTMRGIASDARTRQYRTSTGFFVPDDEDGRGDAVVVTLGLGAPCVEEAWCAHEDQGRADEGLRAIRERVHRHFQDDPAVLWIIQGIEEGLRASAVRARSGMSVKEYESAHRRWRRGLDLLFPGRKAA